MQNLLLPTAPVNPTDNLSISTLRDTLCDLRAALRPGRRGSFTPAAEARLSDVHARVHQLLRDTHGAPLLSRFAPETADNLANWLRSAAAREVITA